MDNFIVENKGFRTHHRYYKKDGTSYSYLAYCIKNKFYNSLKGISFTVDSISLADNVEDTVFVHQIIFNDVVLLTRLKINAGNKYYYPLNDEDLEYSFLRCENDASEENKYIYRKVKPLLGISPDMTYRPKAILID